jgi:hypothetical protein
MSPMLRSTLVLSALEDAPIFEPKAYNASMERIEYSTRIRRARYLCSRSSAVYSAVNNKLTLLTLIKQLKLKV